MISTKTAAAPNHAIVPVLHSLNYSIEFLIEQVDGLTDEQMVAQPAAVSNHPAWTIGHLTFVLEMIGTVVGIEPTLSADWAGRYGPGSKPVPEADVYDTKDSVLSLLRAKTNKLTAVVALLADERLDAPFPDESYLDVFPTVRHALTQVLLGHTAFHVGQVSVWRRAMDLPAMRRGYE